MIMPPETPAPVPASSPRVDVSPCGGLGPHPAEDCPGPHCAGESLPDERGQRTRDRVLLYVRGMDIPPLRSLAFAAESLGRSGPEATQAEAMRSLREVLREEGRIEGRRYGLEDSEEGRLDSAPPMNRRSMIAEELDRRPWLTALGRLFLGRAASPKNAAPPSPEEKHLAGKGSRHD